MAVVPTDALLHQIMDNEILHAGAAFNGVFDLLSMQLFTNAPILSRTSVLADLTAPTYAGYANKTGIAIGAVHQRYDKGWCVDTPLESFVMGDGLLPTTVMGYGCFLAGANTLYWGEYFPEPVSLVFVTDTLAFVAQFCLGGANYGQCTMVP